MKFDEGYRSANVEDRRGRSIGRGGAAGIGVGGLVVLAVLSYVFDVDLLTPALSGGGGGGSQATSAPAASSPDDERLVGLVSFVLDDTQATWRQVFTSSGLTYQDARMVLFTDQVESACGMAESATGPFYCPGDHQVYVDLGFYRELRERFGAPGDFAQAYVIAHEIGHHVQSLLGTERAMRQMQRAEPSRRNELSVRLELQADCFAGVWARSTQRRDLLEAGDVEEAMRAAQQIGDDTLQRGAGRAVQPDSFTHGSSAQRMAWFRRGLESGAIGGCDTFDGPLQ